MNSTGASSAKTRVGFGAWLSQGKTVVGLGSGLVGTSYHMFFGASG